MTRILFIPCFLALCQPIWSAPPLFLLTTSQGNEVEATLVSWEKGMQPQFRLVNQEQPRPVDFLFARLSGGNLPRLPQENCLWLDNGDCLSFSKFQVREEQALIHPLDVMAAEGRDLAVSILDARLVWWKNSYRELQPMRLREQLLQRSDTKDVVILSNGEKVEGILESVDGTALVLEGGESKGRYKLDQLAVLALAAEKPAILPPPRTGVRVVTSSGDRITLNHPTLKGGSLEGTTSFGKLVRIDLAKVRKITNHSNSAVALGDITTMSLEVNPWFSQRIVRKVEFGRVGGEFLLGEDAYESGLNFPGNASLIISAAGKYRGMGVTLGMDARVAGSPKAIVRLMGDGKLIANPLEVVKGKPQRVFVDIAGVREIRVVNQAGPGAQMSIVDGFLIP